MANITDAFKLIAKEFPKFANEMGIPFLGKDEEQSVMKPKSGKQVEKETLETLFKAAPSLLAGGAGAAKLVSSFPKLSGLIANAGTFAATGDPTTFVNGPLGLAMQSNDAEATIGSGNRVKGVKAVRSYIEDVVAELKAGKSIEGGLYKKHGMYNGPVDNKVRAVIDDSNMSQIGDLQNLGEEGQALGSLYKHDVLFDAYPELKDIIVRNLPKGIRAKGGFLSKEMNADPLAKYDTIFVDAKNRTPEEVNSTMLHEMQHGIQKIEGFTPGTSPRDMMSHPAMLKEMDKYVIPDDEAAADYVLGGIAKDLYKRAGGEAEARVVQKMYLDNNLYDSPLDIYDVDISALIKP